MSSPRCLSVFFLPICWNFFVRDETSAFQRTHKQKRQYKLIGEYRQCLNSMSLGSSVFCIVWLWDDLAWFGIFVVAVEINLNPVIGFQIAYTKSYSGQIIKMQNDLITIIIECWTKQWEQNWLTPTNYTRPLCWSRFWARENWKIVSFAIQTQLKPHKI